jgi:hypothetical protein
MIIKSSIMQSDNNTLVVAGYFVALIPVLAIFVRSYDELRIKYRHNMPDVCPEAEFAFSGIVIGTIMYNNLALARIV